MRASLVRSLVAVIVGALSGLAVLEGGEQARGYPGAAPPSDSESACHSLLDIGALTITLAELRPVADSQQLYCQVRGLIAPGIRFHVDLPLPSKWNGRLIGFGDGGTDGLVFSTNPYIQDRVRNGYAVVNSNSGHDDAVEPGLSFAFNNRQAEIDFGYRAVHLSTLAAKWITRVYYGRSPENSYFDGCSNGGRQALIEAQRFPDDFDGILAGAPAAYAQAIAVHKLWMLQKVFANRFAANLAFDTNGDGVPDDVSKVEILAKAVLAKCDAEDGIADGVIDYPPACTFEPTTDLAKHACPGDVNGPTCFTNAQLEVIQDMYRGATDSRGTRIIKGFAKGSERAWANDLVPHAGNKLRPGFLGSGDYANYLFFESDPGIPPIDVTNTTYALNTTAYPAEYGWWQFNIDDVTAGKGKTMSEILDATDPDLSRFVSNPKRRVLIYHGWSDLGIQPEPTVDYYRNVVERTYGGNMAKARTQIRLFMVPGMSHCSGGVGPSSWGDQLAPLIDWVEKGQAPDYLVARHATKGVVDNERRVCAYPERAVYAGPDGGQNNPANWISANWACR